MIRPIVLACGICVPGLAMACNPPSILIGANGDATYYSPTKDTRPALEEIYGPAPDQGLILVVDSRTRAGFWIGQEELGEVQLYFNTTAKLPEYSGPEECRPPQLPIVLPEGGPIPAPTDLFPDNPSETGPQSGVWQAKVGPTEIVGCPAMMRDAFPQSAGALPGMTADPRRMEFANPFHPDTLEMSRTAGLRWRADGDNRWVTTDLGADAFAQIPQGAGGGSRIMLTMTVASPDEISLERAIEIILPAAAAAMMGASPDGCRVTGTDQWVRIGD